MCTIFVKKTNSGVLVGRNFDWLQKGGTLHYIPSQRVYGSQTKQLFLIEQMGVDKPYEGINETGLFIGCAVTPIDLNPPKDDNSKALKMDELGAIRFVLERAATTQEAVNLMETMSLNNSYLDYFLRLHFLIADSDGNIAFYQSGDKTLCKSLEKGQGDAMTNFPKSLAIGNCWRYNTVLRQLNSVRDMETAMKLLETVMQGENTIWSAVFNLNSLEVWLCLENFYTTTHKFYLKEELKKGYASIDFGTLKLSATYSKKLKEQFASHSYKC
jgi:predicted choloylglycine hydrolase